MDTEADGFTVLGSVPTSNMYGEYARMTSATTADVGERAIML